MSAILKTPLLLINFKTYLEGTGQKAFRLAKIAEKVSLDAGVQIIITPQYSDIAKIASKIKIPIFAQHLDPEEAGAHTGYILPEAISAAGAIGTMLNHSERPLTKEKIGSVIKRCKELGLLTCILSNSPEEGAELSKLKPDMIVVEVPELIGTGRAISTVSPQTIKNAIAKIRKNNKKVILIAGSGVTTSKDVKRAIELGMQGVGSSKAVMTSEKPRELLYEMANALLSANSKVLKHSTPQNNIP